MTTTDVYTCKPGDIFIDCAAPLTEEIVAAARAQGVIGFMKYNRYDALPRPKYGSAAEAKLVHDHGGYYMLNWEIQSDRALGGYPVGHSDGARNREAANAMGYPDEVAVPVSVDINTVHGNVDQVMGFLQGHWETDGSGTINFSYLDTDGGREAANRGLDPSLWIPGAFGWSPELYSLLRGLRDQGVPLAEIYDHITALASQNPLALAIQFPSTAAFGIRVDYNRVLKPFKVWGPVHEVSDPSDFVTPPPVVVQPPNPPSEDRMATAILHVPGRNAQFITQGPLNPDGKTVHGLLIAWYGPGPVEASSYLTAQAGAADTIHQDCSVETLKQLVLVGSHPQDIDDVSYSWSSADFAHAVDRP